MKSLIKCTNLRFVFPFALVLMALVHCAPVRADDPAFAEPIVCGNGAIAQVTGTTSPLGFGGSGGRVIDMFVDPNSQSQAGMLVGNIALKNFIFVQLIYIPKQAAITESEQQARVQYCFVDQGNGQLITETKKFSELDISVNAADRNFKNAVATRNTFQNAAIRDGRATLNSLQLVLESGPKLVGLRMGRVQMVGGVRVDTGENNLQAVGETRLRVLPCNRIGDCTTLETRESLSELRAALLRGRVQQRRGNN